MCDLLLYFDISCPEQTAAIHESPMKKPSPQKDTTVPVKTDSVDCSIGSLVCKIHLVIDTNILIQEAGRKFTFFAHLEEHFDSKIVIVIPFAVYLELDHMKKGNREGALKGGDIARMAINFINVQVASGKHFFVIQTKLLYFCGSTFFKSSIS